MQKFPLYRGISRDFFFTGGLVENLALYTDCGGEICILHGLWWRNWHFNGALVRNFHSTEVFLEKLAFYRGFLSTSLLHFQYSIFIYSFLAELINNKEYRCSIAQST